MRRSPCRRRSGTRARHHVDKRAPAQQEAPHLADGRRLVARGRAIENAAFGLAHREPHEDREQRPGIPRRRRPRASRTVRRSCRQAPFRWRSPRRRRSRRSTSPAHADAAGSSRTGSNGRARCRSPRPRSLPSSRRTGASSSGPVRERRQATPDEQPTGDDGAAHRAVGPARDQEASPDVDHAKDVPTSTPIAVSDAPNSILMGSSSAFRMLRSATLKAVTRAKTPSTYTSRRRLSAPIPGPRSAAPRSPSRFSYHNRPGREAYAKCGRWCDTTLFEVRASVQAGYRLLLTAAGSWFVGWGIQMVIYPWLLVSVLEETPARVGAAQDGGDAPVPALHPAGRRDRRSPGAPARARGSSSGRGRRGCRAVRCAAGRRAQLLAARDLRLRDRNFSSLRSPGPRHPALTRRHDRHEPERSPVPRSLSTRDRSWERSWPELRAGWAVHRCSGRRWRSWRSVRYRPCACPLARPNPARAHQSYSRTSSPDCVRYRAPGSCGPC